MKAEDNNIIKSTIHAFLPEAKVLLFGSRARSENGVNSDYDLLIVTKDTFAPRAKMDWESQIRKALINTFRLPFDVIIQSSKEVADKRNLRGHIVYYAMKEAIEI